MANNTFVDPHKVVSVSIALLRQDLVLAGTVNTDYAAEFGGGRGSSVDVRVPATLKARTRGIGDNTTAVVMDNLTETTVSVSLDTMAYSAVPVTDADLSLSITNFAEQVLSPQTIAISEYVENTIADELMALPEDTTIAWDPTKPQAMFSAARKKLRDLGVPAAGLYAACGTAVAEALIESLANVADSGTDSALREANIGRVRGFQAFECNRLGETDVVFYSRDAFTLAVRAPRVPDGVPFGQSLAQDGFALRWIRDYDPTVLQDRSIVSTFVGTQAMQVKVINRDGTTSMVTPALRVDTATP